MLSPDEVKPLLVHEDQYVRAAAIRYFRGTWSQDPDIVPLILEACRRYGARTSLNAVAWCERFALDEHVLEDVLDTLATTADSNIAYHLNAAVANAPIALQISQRSVILNTPNLRRETVDAMDRRRTVANWSAQKLWSELETVADRSSADQYARQIDHGYVNALVSALSSREEDHPENVCGLLESIGEDNGWLEIFLIKLVGERRLQGAVAALVDKYRVDADYMLECVTDALSQIGDEEAVRIIRVAFPNESWTFKNYSTTVLGNIKHQESENALLALLDNEEDLSFRTKICLELCTLFSRPGVSAVLKEIRSGYDTWMANLKEYVLPVADVLDIDVPEADEWQAERQEREEYRARKEAELEELCRRHEAAKSKGAGRSGAAIAGAATTVEESTTIRREAPKVGRNDTCPCGSGRKFKKCCARKPR